MKAGSLIDKAIAEPTARNIAGKITTYG